MTVSGCKNRTHCREIDFLAINVSMDCVRGSGDEPQDDFEKCLLAKSVA